MTKQDSKAIKKALALRARMKRKKPKFVRPESWRYVRLKENWRNPRGLDNKVRRKIKGWPPSPEAGYRGPKIARNLHPSGYREILVYNVEDVAKVDPKTQAIRIAHTVSKRKRLNIILEARRRKIVVLNPREAKEAPLERKKAKKEKEETEEEEIAEEELHEEAAEEEKEAKKEALDKEEEKPKRRQRKPKAKSGAKKE